MLQRTVDIGMVCNGLVAGLVAITAPSGYVENWAAPIIGIVGGLIVVPSIMLIDKKVDDPVGVLAHGLAGVWGTLACGLFTAPRFAEYAGIGDPNGGLVYSGSFQQLFDQAIGVVVVFALVLTLCLITWYAIAKTIGLRVSEEAEIAGLDISEHGMYGYPEQFISDAELYGPAVPGRRSSSTGTRRHRPGPLRLRRPSAEAAVLLRTACKGVRARFLHARTIPRMGAVADRAGAVGHRRRRRLPRPRRSSATRRSSSTTAASRAR